MTIQFLAATGHINSDRCNGGVNQKRAFEYAGGDYFRLINLYGGKYLGQARASTANGTNIIPYACGTVANPAVEPDKA